MKPLSPSKAPQIELYRRLPDLLRRTFHNLGAVGIKTIRQFLNPRYISNPFQRLAASFLLVTLAGCTMIPNYQQPPANVSSSWPTVPGYAKIQTAPATVPASAIGWKDFFRDPRLQQVIAMALTNNPSLRAAMETVVQNQQLYHVQQGNLVPTGALNANGERTRIPNFFGPSAKPITYTEYQVNLGISQYELDLFGRVRSLTRQALETYFASAEAQRAAQIALVAQVATAYLTEQEAAQQLTIARETLKSARQSFDLTKHSFEAGVVSQFDLNTASTQLSTASASVAAYAQQLAEASDNLTLLVGRPLPPALQPSPRLDLNLCLSDIPAGLPSDLLEQRPDILEAEHTLKAANANIGAARAAFFPTITLTANGGFASSSLESLFSAGSSAWLFQPQLAWSVFDLGQAYHELQAQKAVKEAQAANYQSAIQTAFKEVADALAVRQTVDSQLKDNEALVKSDQQTYDLTEAGFKSGVNSSLDVLVTLQTLDSARENLIQTQYSRLVSLINLYQALGGGWNEYTPQSQQQAAKN
ncbi:MAG TPA: efflux transporter outer membrane subunit [Verrucomicrobiae bacterium]|nr:efflux transporter outer membrane subunit [Verrucomicrobiae bacterium]